MNRDSINLRALGVGLMVVGVIVVLLGALQAYQQYSVLRQWTPVEAQFVRTDVRNEKFQTSIRMGRADRYIVTWTFRYDVGGAAHEAVADPDVHGTRAQMVAWIHRFHPGEQVTIHYNPADSGEISAAAYDWLTFAHAAWVGAWGAGIAILGFAFRRFSP
jgi:hypothetical protein